MVNDSVRLDRIFASMSDAQIQKLTSKVNHVVNIVIGLAAIGTAIMIIVGRHHN